MGSLEKRLRVLESRTPTPPPGSLCEEMRAIDAEIRALEEALAGTKQDEETEAFFESLEGLSLDEKIAVLEQEIAREEG